jgi:hypothetical protein
MTNNSNSSRIEVPEAKANMDAFKQQIASELGINLKKGYNGDLTSREAGYIGGTMVKRMIQAQEQQMLNSGSTTPMGSMGNMGGTTQNSNY